MKNNSYEECKKEFQETGLDWMESIARVYGYSSKDVEKVFNQENQKQNQRDKIIDQILNDSELKTELIRDDFPLRLFRIQYNNKVIYLQHAVEPELHLFNDYEMRYTDYTIIPYDYIEDALKMVKDYTEKEGKDISIDKSKDSTKEDQEIERE